MLNYPIFKANWQHDTIKEDGFFLLLFYAN